VEAEAVELKSGEAEVELEDIEHLFQVEQKFH
jgi:hypothetical protein